MARMIHITEARRMVHEARNEFIVGLQAGLKPTLDRMDAECRAKAEAEIDRRIHKAWADAESRFMAAFGGVPTE